MPTLKDKRQELVQAAHLRRQHKRARRVKISMPVVLETSPGCRVKAIVDDLSGDGFRVRSRIVLEPGQSVTLHTPRESIACEVKWVRGREAGGMFTERPEFSSW